MRQRIIRTGTLIVVLVAALLIASAQAALASARGTAEATSSTDCPQPPNNVDHATFTDAQLALYGLPPRGHGGSLSQWQETVRSAKHRFCHGTPTDHYARGQSAAKPASGTETSHNWTGYVAINYGYSEVLGYWYVPCLTLLLKKGYSAVWTGLGGDPNDGNGPLVQAGTEQDEHQDWIGRWVTDNYAWYEDYPPQSQQRAFGVGCGDNISVDVYQDSQAHMSLYDHTNNNYFNQPNSQLSNGSTVEWIVERPDINGQLPGLSDFVSVAFTYSIGIRNGTSYYVNDLPNNKVPYMLGNDNSTHLAETDDVGGSGAITVHWRNYGP